MSPVNGGWSNWGPYSRCSRTCGGGQKTRRRTCNKPPASHGGLPCPGAATQATRCNINPCRKLQYIYIDDDYR